jgi:hypothetical protein
MILRKSRAPAGTGVTGARPPAGRSLWATWFGRRALLLHLLLILVAPGCALAGWWQATRALAGNGLSWVYSVEWPIFALLAIWGWWHLIHEDPEAYAARKARPNVETPVNAGDVAGGRADPVSTAGTALAMEAIQSPDAAAAGAQPVELPVAVGAAALAAPRVDPSTAQVATLLALGIAVEFLLGVAGLIAIPIGRPSGFLPAKGAPVYLTHAVAGAGLLAGAILLAVRASARGATRTARAVAWTGLIGIVVAGAGGLLTAGTSVVRFFGMALMFVGPAIAGFAYLVPVMLLRSSRRRSAAELSS